MTLTRLDNQIRATLGESGLTSGPCSNTELLKIHTEIRAGLRNTTPAAPAGPGGSGGQNHNETIIRSRH